MTATRAGKAPPLHDNEQAPHTGLLVACAVAIVAIEIGLIWLTRGLNHDNAITFRAVLPLIFGLGAATALLLLARQFLTRLEPTRRVLAIVFLAGLAMRALWFGQPAPLEDDFKRYLLDGAVVSRGLDPYRHPPELLFETTTTPPEYADIAAAGRSTIKGINFPDMRTIYPTTAQLSFALASLILPFDVDGLRLVFMAGEIATFFLLLALLTSRGQSPMWSALYWWNPFVVHMGVGIAHVDALVPTFVLGALLMALRKRIEVSLALLGAAAGIKIWPVLLAPLVLAPLRHEPARLIRAGLVVAVAIAIAVGPVMLSALRPGSGLTAYAGGWSMNNAFFAWIASAIAGVAGWPGAQQIMRVAIGFAVAATALTVAWRSDNSPHVLASGFLVIAATVFYLSPAQFPWYALWFLPLAALTGNMPLLLASATLPAYYLFYPLWGSGRGDTFFYGAAFLHAIPVLLWLLIRAMRHSSTPNSNRID